MATKAKGRPGPVRSVSDTPASNFWVTPPASTEERLTRIQSLGERIAGHIRYISAVAGMAGTSAEAKEVAVTAFYDRLLAFEQELDRIQEALRLG